MIANICIFLIQGLRPLLGPAICYFPEESCSIYACNQLKTQPFLTALFNITKRLLSCNPFTMK